MKARSKGSNRLAPARGPAAQHLCSAWELDSTSFAWDNRWGMPLEAAAVGAFAGDDVMRPPTPTIFQQARRWYRLHAFIRNIIHLKLGFYNYGLLGEQLVPVNPKKPDGEKRLVVHPGIRATDSKDEDRIELWKEKNAEEIARVAIDVWLGFIMLRNVVSLWRKNGRVISKPPESVTYKDDFGIEELKLKHGLANDQIDGMPGLSKAEKDRLRASKDLTLTHDDKQFFFKVLKEEPVGMGFGWPDLVTLFHACSLNESLLVSDRQLANACRSVYEQHKLGHEIKSGNHAGSPAHFMKKERGEAVKNQIKSKVGHIQLATNFDHEIVIGAGRPKPEMFDTKRYAQVAEQMATWGMPFAQMLNGQINPNLMIMARQLADTDRKRVRPYLMALLREALLAPAAITLQWDDSCFWDSRMLLDLLKAGVQAGPISQESFLRLTLGNPAQEREAKARDAELPDKLLLPAFDSAHGAGPRHGNKMAQAGPGKPAGKNDPS
jgi:hypothetical protein